VNIGAIAAAVVTALGGASGIAVIIKQLANAAAIRAQAKKLSEDGHTKTHELLAEIRAAQKARESKEVRDLRKRVADLEKELAEAKQTKLENTQKEEPA
jgi:uncharacterized protein YlxW (UPF0749 family)